MEDDLIVHSPAQRVASQDSVTVGPPPGRIAVVGVVVVLVLAAWLARPSGGPSSEAVAPPESPTTVPAPADEQADRGGDDSSDGSTDTGGLVPSVDVPAVVEGMGLTLAEVTEDGLRLWSVDLSTGRIDALPLPESVTVAPVADVRFFGNDRAVVSDGDGRYHVLAIDGDAVELVRSVEFGTRQSFGGDGLTPDGQQAWIATDSGLIRWRLDDDEVDRRWIDMFGDRTRLPDVRTTVDSGLVAQGSARSYLVTGAVIDPLDLAGEVVDGARDWVAVRTCDDTMRCGRLDLFEVGSGVTVPLSADYRFRTNCGLVVGAAAERSVHVLAERLGTAVLLTASPDGIVDEIDLHAAGIGCVDAVAVGSNRVVIAHERALTLVDTSTESEADVELVHLTGLSRIVAVGLRAE